MYLVILTEIKILQ